MGEVLLRTVGASLLALEVVLLAVRLGAQTRILTVDKTASSVAPTGSKKARIVSKRAPQINCEQRSSQP